MSFAARDLVKVCDLVLTVRSIDGNVLELESADGAFFGFRHINNVERVPAAQETAAAVVAHTVPVGSGDAPYRSARMSGSVAFGLCPDRSTACCHLSPSRDSLIPSRMAYLITRYVIQIPKAADKIDIAIKNRASRVISISNAVQFAMVFFLPLFPMVSGLD